MRARTVAAVDPGGVLAELHCEPPLTLRQVAAAAGRCGLCLVGTAAGPLAGDDLELHLDVRARGRADLVATGASIAQGRDAAPSRLAFSAAVGPAAELVADPGPLVVAAGSRVAAAVRLDLAADATVRWHELVVLGRSGEPAGAATLRWDVERGGRPVLRQQVDVATTRHRVLASVFATAPDLTARTVVLDPTAVAQRVDPHTQLVTVLGHDVAEVRTRLTALLGEVGY